MSTAGVSDLDLDDDKLDLLRRLPVKFTLFFHHNSNFYLTPPVIFMKQLLPADVALAH